MSKRLQPPTVGVQRVYVDLEDRRHSSDPSENVDGAVRRLLAKDLAPRRHDIADGRYPSALIIRRGAAFSLAHLSATTF
jgi:hypothetical protein